MTLRCECGGSLELTYCTPSDQDVERWTERYKCASCGRTGGGNFPADHAGRADYWWCVDA